MGGRERAAPVLVLVSSCSQSPLLTQVVVVAADKRVEHLVAPALALGSQPASLDHLLAAEVKLAPAQQEDGHHEHTAAGSTLHATQE